MSKEAFGHRWAWVTTFALLGVALGLFSEWTSAVAEPAVWAPDLAVGCTFITGGLVVIGRQAGVGSGVLMLATGLTWFLPNFGSVSVGWLAWAAAHAVYLHRGPLIQLLVTFPAGRPASRLSRTTVVIGYLSALSWVWAEDLIAVPLAILLFAMAAVDQRRLRGSVRRARGIGVRALGLMTLALAGTALARALVADDGPLPATRWVVEMALCLVAVWLVVSLLRGRWARTTVTDLVVQMGMFRSDLVRDDFARALGDPTLQIGYWAPDRSGWVDSRGRAFTVPEDGAARSVTPVDSPDGPLAVLVHDPSVLDDPGLIADVRAAATLAAENARLQADVRDRVAELEASRRRLLEAADEERRRLEQRLHDGALRRLQDLAMTVAAARSASTGPRTAERLTRVEAELQATLVDLAMLGRGLHPRELGELGLGGALHLLAVRAPLDVSLSVTADAAHAAASATSVAAAVYYLCSEALTNVSKHADATTAHISVGFSTGHLLVEVADDGVGGTVGRRGSGLRELTDRIETLGGTLTVVSPVGAGTCLRARIPLAPERVG